jgi:hypothetical protein
MVYRAIHLDSKASSWLHVVANILPVAAVANIIIVLVIWRLAVADSRRQAESAGALQADKISLERQIAASAGDLRDMMSAHGTRELVRQAKALGVRSFSISRSRWRR